MKINYGLKSGAVLQRDENNLCRCTFGADVCGEIRSSIGKTEKIGDGVYSLEGIPVGGPYDIIISDDFADTKIKLVFADGSEMVIDENDYLCSENSPEKF